MFLFRKSHSDVGPDHVRPQPSADEDPISTLPSFNSLLMYRRNGKRISCEPCRISKVRCDHAAPVCARCQTRGAPEKVPTTKDIMYQCIPRVH